MGVFRTIDAFLREEGAFAPRPAIEEESHPPISIYVGLIGAAGVTYGVAMGSFGVAATDGWLRILLSAVKVPILFGVTFLLCLPPFFMLLAAAGLADVVATNRAAQANAVAVAGGRRFLRLADAVAAGWLVAVQAATEAILAHAGVAGVVAAVRQVYRAEERRDA